MPLTPELVALRPQADARIDKAAYARYDPAPDRKTGAIVIVVQGGNYDESSIGGHESQDIAQWLVSLGVTAVVLQFRCVAEGHYWPAQYEDWMDCFRAVKARAGVWGCDAGRIGVIGFCSGGHLAAYAAVQREPEVRPALQMLIYPAIDTLSPHEDGAIDPWTPSQGYPPAETSAHLHVGPHVPPAFLAGITTDRYTPAHENTEVYADALAEYGVPCKYITDADSDHGCGLQDWWSLPCAEWLVEQGWACAPAA